MYLYSIYTRREDKNHNLIIIKQGFSLWALLFSFFWAIYHKMWMVVAIMILVNFITFSAYDSENASTIEHLKYVVQLFVFGFFSSELREFYAQKQGMELDDIILANSDEEAESKYIMRTNS